MTRAILLDSRPSQKDATFARALCAKLDAISIGTTIENVNNPLLDGIIALFYDSEFTAIDPDDDAFLLQSPNNCPNTTNQYLKDCLEGLIDEHLGADFLIDRCVERCKQTLEIFDCVIVHGIRRWEEVEKFSKDIPCVVLSLNGTITNLSDNRGVDVIHLETASDPVEATIIAFSNQGEKLDAKV